MSETPERPGESMLIARHFAPLCAGDGAFGLTDDTAFLTVEEGYELVLTKDMLVADIHFFEDDAPDLIARKALRVNLSDLASKGARPRGYLLGLGLPDSWEESWLAFFCSGLKKDQELFDFPLFGGDTVKSPERLVLSITAFGQVKKGCKVLRSTARAGDLVYVSGVIGDGALGLEARQSNLDLHLPDHQGDPLTRRYMMPQPRTELADIIGTFATASMDISDGLIGDADKMAKASGVGLEIEQERVPLSPTASRLVDQAPHYWQQILTGGDDYELLFCIDPARETDFLAATATTGIPVTKVGKATTGSGVMLIGDISLDQKTAFEHF